MIVGGAKTFQLHSDLLAHESDCLAKDVKGGFLEEQSKTIILHEEDPELFGYFVEYLYRSESFVSIIGKNRQNNSDYVILARLYALGDRLQAQRFQHAVLCKFTSFFTSNTNLLDQGICDLLEIVCEQLPEKSNEDPLRAQVFWYAACRLKNLQKYNYFRELLERQPDLGRFLCTRAGNSTASQPSKPSGPLLQRFEPEGI